MVLIQAISIAVFALPCPTVVCTFTELPSEPQEDYEQIPDIISATPGDSCSALQSLKSNITAMQKDVNRRLTSLEEMMAIMLASQEELRCHLVRGGPLTNVALGKPTYTLNWSGGKEVGTSGLAVDGNKSMDNKDCTTNSRTKEPWWMVDLQNSYVVNQVSMSTQDNSGAFWLSNFEIRVGSNQDDFTKNALCHYQKDSHTRRAVSTYACMSPLEGSIVSIQLKYRSSGVRILNLCEVEVMSKGMC